MLNTSLPNQEINGEADNGLSFDDLEKADILSSFKNHLNNNSRCGGSACASSKTIPAICIDKFDIFVVAWCKECMNNHSLNFIELTDKHIFIIKVLHGL